MRRTAILLALVCMVALPGAALAARFLSYQGYTSQGYDIKFKRAKAGVSRMSITVRASCFDDKGVNQGDYAFQMKATDAVADPVAGGRFTAKLSGAGKVPDALIKGKFNSRGTGRGTITASGHGVGPNGEDLGTCRTPEGGVRWTAAP